MRFPNPALRLSWLPERVQRWRLERGILTGRWTQEQIDRAYAEARRMREALGLTEDRVQVVPLSVVSARGPFEGPVTRIEHNLGNQDVLVHCYDTNGEPVFNVTVHLLSRTALEISHTQVLERVVVVS